MSGREFIRDDLLGSGGASNLQFNEEIKALQASGQKIHHLGFGQSPFPVPEFAQEELKKFAHVGQYLPVRGLPQLREAIQESHKRKEGLDHFEVGDIVVAPGSKELIFLLMNVTKGDVLVCAPTWTTYRPQGVLAHHKVFLLPTTFEGNWKLTPEIISEAYRKNEIKDGSILIFCNPDNPTGASYNATELEALSVEFRKHKLIVLSDEIYARLLFEGNYTSVAKFYPEGTVVSSGISKWASCGGWRLGYHLYPAQLSAISKAVASAGSQTFTSCSAPIQYAAIPLLRFGADAEEYVTHCGRILFAVAKFCCENLRKVGVKVHLPASGYYIFPDFEVMRKCLPDVTFGEQFCKLMLNETGVAVMAGGPSYLHPNERFTARLCYINFDGEVALKESRKIGLKCDLPASFVRDFCTPTYEAITSVVEWMKVCTQEKC